MGSQPVDSGNRVRENGVDVLIFAVAVGLSVLAIVEVGPVGLGIASVLLGAAAALVVGRQESATAVAATDARSEGAIAADGGRLDD